MSFNPEFFTADRIYGNPVPKTTWYENEIAGIFRSRDLKPSNKEYWFHTHGNTREEALAAARDYFVDYQLQDTFKLGDGSILSTDQWDQGDLGFFWRLEVLDPEKAKEFDPQEQSNDWRRILNYGSGTQGDRGVPDGFSWTLE